MACRRFVDREELVFIAHKHFDWVDPALRTELVFIAHKLLAARRFRASAAGWR